MMTNTYFPIVGGLEQSVYSFGEEFRSLGHEVLIVTPAFGGAPAEEPGVLRIPAIQKFSGTVFSINLPVSGLLTRLMKEFMPDMVHSHCPFFMGDFALRLSRQHAIPLVFTYHTMFEQYMHDWPVRNEGVKRFIVKLASGYANLADQVIVPSESVKEILLKRGVKTPMEVVPTGVDLERFAKGDGKTFRQEHQIPLDALVVGHAGRLAPEKNLEFLTNCMVEFLKKEPRAHVLIVGLGPSEEMIKKTFAQAGFEKRLHLTGVLHYQQLVDAYFAMDVFAFASLSETQGIVLIEAMAAGLSVVALDAPGAREVVVDYHNGRLLKQMDKASFVDALAWVLSRPSEELRTVKQVTRMIAQKYPINSAAKRMLEVYERVRSRRAISLGKKNSSRYLFGWRLKVEWDIYCNYIKSVLTSVFKGNFQKTEPEKICDTTGSLSDGAMICPSNEGEIDRYVMTEDGERIALVHLKRGFSKVVIIAHGFYNNKDTFLFRKIAEALSKEYDVIVFDFRGHGKSGGKFSWTAYEHKDLQAVIGYAKENRYTKIGVIGFSLGAAAALIQASNHQDIDSLIVVSAPADPKSINYHFWEKDMWEDLKLNFGIKGQGKGVRPGNPFLKKIRPLDIVDKVSPMPVLFLHGEKDWLVKPGHSRRLFEKAKDPKALTIIKNGGHAERMFDVFPDQFIKICLDRFRETL
jgi:glycosyltransferase involved in cell wall biosynthesis/pimeloyl-ACP methyl ester carboxylesterase